MLISLGIVVLGLVALVIFLKKKRVAITPLSLRTVAHSEAAAALAQLGELAPREAAVQASLVLRKYLSTVAKDPALFETHEEYLVRHQALNKFSDEAREATRLGFARLAAMKYSPKSPDMDTPQVVSGSQYLLEILHHGMRP